MKKNRRKPNPNADGLDSAREEVLMTTNQIQTCTHTVPENTYGIFAMHCNDNQPLSPEEQRKILDGPIAAAEARLKDEIAKPLDLTASEECVRNT